MSLVSPSLLSANFARLEDEIDMLNRSDADMIHLDIMDGVFVPNISFGFPVIDGIKNICKKPLDVHLMIVEPEKWVSRVRDCGAAIMNVHVEAARHLNRLVESIRHAGMKPAVTLNPATPLCLLEEVICDVDMVLLMSVNPGFGGQKFIGNIIDKTRRLKGMIADSSSNALIEVDGGINASTGAAVVEAGADILVAGNYVFKSLKPEEAIRTLKAL